MKFGCVTGLLLAVWALVMAPAANAELRLSEGVWRTEIAASAGIHSGKTDRGGDFLWVGSVEYEIPASERCTLGLRLLPLFLYEQHGNGSGGWGDRWAHERKDDNVLGGGLGLSGRIYQVAEERRGLFFELSTHLIAHDAEFAGNGSSVNFISGAAAGYKWRQGWHVALKYDHISNAGFHDRNAGVNTLGLGVGYTF